MTGTFLKSTTAAALASLLAFAASAFAQDGTIYPLEAPAEPGAIPLGTGGVKDQPGGHGFGMGYPNHPTYWWFEPFTHWLDVTGFLKAKSAK